MAQYKHYTRTHFFSQKYDFFKEDKETWFPKGLNDPLELPKFPTTIKQFYSFKVFGSPPSIKPTHKQATRNKKVL